MFFLYYGFSLLLLFFFVPHWVFAVIVVVSGLAILYSRRYLKFLKTPIKKFRI